MERKQAAEDEIHARCDILKARARTYLAEYLKDPEGASYVTASLDEKTEKTSQESQTPENGQMTKLTVRPVNVA